MPCIRPCHSWRKISDDLALIFEVRKAPSRNEGSYTCVKSQYISIEDVAGRLNPARPGKRFMAMLWFYCDESYESKPQMSRTYVVAGFVAEEDTWKKIEKRWRHVNKHR